MFVKLEKKIEDEEEEQSLAIGQVLPVVRLKFISTMRFMVLDIKRSNKEIINLQRLLFFSHHS